MNYLGVGLSCLSAPVILSQLLVVHELGNRTETQ